MKQKTIFLTTALLYLVQLPLQAQSVRQILDKMYQKIDRVSHVTYTLKSKERIKGKMIHKHMKFRVHENPKKMYMKDQDSGVELLYVKNWNNNKAFINPNGFPWVNVSLSIFDRRVRKDGHHSVLHSGFAYLVRLMRHVEKQIKGRNEKIETYIQYKGSYTWEGMSCYKVVLEDSKFHYYNYTCSKGESLFALSERLNLSEYMIMEKNNLGYNAKLSAGQTLKLPTSFAKKVVLYIDKSNNIPVRQEIYDDKGLFEQYEFLSVRLNPSLDNKEWTTACKSYGF